MLIRAVVFVLLTMTTLVAESVSIPGNGVESKMTNENNPSPDVGNNKMTFDLYLSVRF